MKKQKSIFWVTTLIIVLFEGVMPAFTFNTELAKAGIAHLGYPAYFGYLLTLFKVLGAIGLLLPQIKGRAKEWVYAGFTFDFAFAFLSYLIVDGFVAGLIMPVAFIIVLILSYRSYHRLQKVQM